VGRVCCEYRIETREKEKEGVIMRWWESFADSLNTRGGTIALLFVACMLLGLGLLHVMHHGDSGQASATIVSTFSAFAGALLLALTQKDKTNGNGGSK
jgi:hypothetical protein